MSARWSDLAAADLDIAGHGRRLLYQFGVGLAYLATVRPDGGPRVHPMCPILFEDGLYAFITKSPKLGDLRRDGRYALHTFGPADNDDEFYLTGTVRECDDDATGRPIRSQFRRERNLPDDDWHEAGEVLFELLIDSALVGLTSGHGDTPTHTLWRP